MDLNALTAVSPVDGRYFSKTFALSPYFSEFALIRNRCRVEVAWLKFLCADARFEHMDALSDDAVQWLDALVDGFDLKAAERVKEIEATTRHDLKAAEYYLKEAVQEHPELKVASEFFHFACTSEDVNNLSWALSLRQARAAVDSSHLSTLLNTLCALSREHASVFMMSRTHGQSATPSSIGKEFSIFAHRLARQIDSIRSVRILGKFNGAVGNFNAHVAAYPDVDWLDVSRTFVQSLGLDWNSHTTQIEPHDFIAELFDAFQRLNTVLLDLCKDMWTYISLGYFKQKRIEGEVGSSTMPHKVNPIDFENAEGNLGIANALMAHIGSKLPISRMQRDLTDSTVLRNLGVGFAYSVIGYSSLLFGLKKGEVNRSVVASELDEHWELLAEPIQTVMRKYRMEAPYEALKKLTQGQSVTQETLHTFIRELPEQLPSSEREALLKLTPSTYCGLTVQLALSLPEGCG
ncbi:Adenylosuccinate lyase [Porphyridium purpureum]|uniref:Adenylosuccinate lyase n=1 Tax=Porphyridium purpureum TaxID=35688 RepID=A0A5J4YXQ4_PORPP|nr:Adenylosuccinate lyase [Porphyridium purpureum]|eukprot:POR6185..scf209_3